MRREFILDLTGRWELTRAGTKDAPVPAAVPGCVHLDLLAAGAIPDPLLSDNERGLMWIGDADWLYRRAFDAPPDLLEQARVELECDGLDTLATVRLNGTVVLRADNMFRRWTADVRDVLRPGANTINVAFASATAYQKEKRELRPFNWIRKEACNFGWDWGPTCVTAGIWRPIRIRAWSAPRLGDVAVRQSHSDRRVALDVSAAVRAVGRAEGLRADVSVSLGGKPVCRAQAPVARGRASVALTVAKPALWWPNGLGAQPLYEVAVRLLAADGTELDTWTRRIGLRTLELVQQKDAWGRSFHFRCNGVDFFAKGANWIPNDVFQARVTRGDYADRLGAAAAAHMNMIRCWGGGIYEQDDFYDLCDELGLCVWQDFMFACDSYPACDPAYMANVRREAEENVTRLRHHACLALWCGNNEVEQMSRWLIGETHPKMMTVAEYRTLFDGLLPGVLRRLAPGCPYIPSSEHSPVKGMKRWTDTHDAASGDAHVWEVGGGGASFEGYRSSFHRFCSEFGFQSFPEPRTVHAYAEPHERNVASYMMEYHQRKRNGNPNIVRQMMSTFRLPGDFDLALWVSQIHQGLAIKCAVEHWRRNRPRCMGALYWQLNDCWPVASWASIDSYGRRKALQYMARHFFAPVLVSGVEDAASGEVAVHICSDERRPRAAALRWHVTRADGISLVRGRRELRIAANVSAMVHTVCLKPLLDRHTERDLLVWLALEDAAGAVLSRDLVAFCRPKHLALRDPAIAVRVAAGGANGFRVTLTAARPALWVWLELADCDAVYSDNFVCLEPGVPVELHVSPAKPMGLAAFRGALAVRNLRDTYA